MILPGAAYVEMALAAAREIYGGDSVTLADLEIQQPMIFAEEALREIAVRLSPAANLIQILSRPRLSQAPWQLHVVAKLVEGDTPEAVVPDFECDAERVMDGAELYRRAEEAGLAFGPSFRAVAAATAILSSPTPMRCTIRRSRGLATAPAPTSPQQVMIATGSYFATKRSISCRCAGTAGPVTSL